MADATGESTLLERVERWRERMGQLDLLDAGQNARIGSALDDARKGGLLAPPRPILTVMLLGASGAGKSELLNALAGERIAEAGHIRPTTTRPALYLHRQIADEQLLELGDSMSALAREPDVRCAHERDALRDKIVVDAPDIDSYQQAHRRQVMELLPAVDVVLYVVTPHNYKDDVGWQLVLKERGRRAFAFVMNKWDPEGKSPVGPGQPDVDDDFLSMLRGAGYSEPLLFRTSAKYWFARRAGETEVPRPPAGDQFLELEEWLSHGLPRSRMAAIQSRRRKAAWAQLMAALSAGTPEVPKHAEWQRSLDMGIDELRDAGWRLIAPVLAAQADAIAAAGNAQRLPRTPGVFGQLLRAPSRIVRRATRLWSRPAIPWSAAAKVSDDRSSATSPADGALCVSGHLSPVIEDATLSALVQMLESRVASFEWSARENGIPVEWLGVRWNGSATQVPARLSRAFQAASAELLTRGRSRTLLFLGYVSIVAVDLAMTAAVGLALWRVGWGFVRGEYLGGAFAANFLVLLVCLFLVGRTAVSLFFSTSAARIRRQLGRRVFAEWNAALAPLKDAARDFLEELAGLRGEADQLLDIAAREIRTLESQPDQEVEALF